MRSLGIALLMVSLHFALNLAAVLIDSWTVENSRYMNTVRSSSHTKMKTDQTLKGS